MTGLYLAFPRWRGFSLGMAEPDLFSHVWVLGYASVYVCRQCLVETVRKLRVTIKQAIDKTEGR